MGRIHPEIQKIDFEGLRTVYEDMPVVLDLIDQFERHFAISKHIEAWFRMTGMSPIGWEPVDFQLQHFAADLPRLTLTMINTGRKP